MLGIETIKTQVLVELQKDEDFRRKFIVILMNDEIIKNYMREELK